ncbi:LysR family transcriptional regulator [Myxococcus sp. K15C18031901]|uniref:LysR family transcriptional regulator n=1 Tax=Myxococcus dinghuensis TaxID=2906761 RepID=UPI0020A6E254|nr:LysR family transcriptional regulator [Myxococcus dinghuensis]MCP3100629.1 LysR family transcriptional regulator [Myxococcus dinghuensis]
MDLDPRYLETFLMVSRERGFGRAATLLHRTQPAVSYQIQKLEEQLGTRLFDRTTRRLTLTESGAKLHALCERFFEEFGRLAKAFQEGDSAPSPLRIASVSGFGRYVLYPLLSREAKAAPYSLRYPTADQVFTSLEDGTCDVGFVYLPHVSSRLLTTPVWREKLVLVGPASERGRPMPSLAAFETLPFVTYDECEYVFGRWFEAIYGRQPRSVRGTYHFEELEEVVGTVAAGHGWSILPDHCVARAVREGTVFVPRFPGRKQVVNRIYAVRRANAPEHPTALRLIEALCVASGQDGDVPPEPVKRRSRSTKR